MTSKQKRGLFLGIFIPSGIVGTAIISLPLIFFILLIISFNWPYHIHRPAVLNQVEDVFADENGRVYYLQNGFLWYFDKSDNKTPHLFDRTDGNGELLNSNGLIRDDNYFYYIFDDGNRGGQTNYWIKIYDRKFDLQDTVILPDDMFVWGKCIREQKIYYVLKTRYVDKCDLFCYDIQTKVTRLIKENIETNTTIEDGEIKLFCDRSYNLQTLSKKTLLNYWWDQELKISHKYYENVVDIWLNNKGICAQINGEQYFFDKDRDFNTLCVNAFLIDNKVVFGAYDYIENKDCGNYSGSYCICNQGKSFLYVLDLDTKELNLTDEYEVGTYLIDYDLDGAKYYYDGGLYINNVFYRECEKIEPGPIEIKRGEGYFRSEERKIDYDVSYLSGEFYGI